MIWKGTVGTETPGEDTQKPTEDTETPADETEKPDQDATTETTNSSDKQDQ